MSPFEYFLLKKMLFAIEGEESFLFGLKLHKSKIMDYHGSEILISFLHCIRLGIIQVVAGSLPLMVVDPRSTSLGEACQ